ncbi:MAG: methylated-DNA--[protein]-cysteine S-methyltransferase [Phycisphaerae bacterium]|nr:methylated-DNA--[protein]-cysteine S-methyltransferase [Phycisphaerae bacterium]
MGKISKHHRHVVFETSWGFCGLGGVGDCLRYSTLPVSGTAEALELIAARQSDSRYDAALFGDLQKQVRAYFEGTYVDFSDVPADLSNMSTFSRHVLAACRSIPYGQTASYARLAAIAGSPRAIRAAGSVMAANPLPLIIPCHRIIRSDGRVGSFSATGGPQLKVRLLAVEAQGACGDMRRQALVV